MIFPLALFGATFILNFKFLAYAYRELWSTGKNDHPPPPVMIYYNKRLFAASALLGVWRVMSTLSTKAPGNAVSAWLLDPSWADYERSMLYIFI